jgi:hypothetical protein
MATDSEKGIVGVGAVVSDSSKHATEDEYDPELARLFQEREAAIQRILARRNPELIKQGIARTSAICRGFSRKIASGRRSLTAETRSSPSGPRSASLKRGSRRRVSQTGVSCG